MKCDFSVTEADNPFEETGMWVAVEEKNADMLSEAVYDPFVLVPLILGMYYHQDVHIDGHVSPRLYHNITHYLMNIFDRFSDRTQPVKLNVKGLASVEEGPGSLVGTGISCGVDSLVTIYDNYIKTTDPAFRINSLFFVNCGTHGDYEKEETRQRWQDRVLMNRGGAEELGLPMYLVDSNFHAFTHKIGEQKIGYLAIYSCVLSLQKYIRRYLTSSNLSYDEIGKNAKLSRDFDIAEYCESFMPHLISTERFELVIDGCQYTRAEKIERISGWGFAQKHLNVCISPINHGWNCSCCEKCMWTLIPLEAMGKLEDFKGVFDLPEYRKKALGWKIKFVARQRRDSMEGSVIQYAKRKGMRQPNYALANIAYLLMRICRKLRSFLRSR